MTNKKNNSETTVFTKKEIEDQLKKAGTKRPDELFTKEEIEEQINNIPQQNNTELPEKESVERELKKKTDKNHIKSSETAVFSKDEITKQIEQGKKLREEKEKQKAPVNAPETVTLEPQTQVMKSESSGSGTIEFRKPETAGKEQTTSVPSETKVIKRDEKPEIKIKTEPERPKGFYKPVEKKDNKKVTLIITVAVALIFIILAIVMIFKNLSKISEAEVKTNDKAELAELLSEEAPRKRQPVKKELKEVIWDKLPDYTFKTEQKIRARKKGPLFSIENDSILAGICTIFKDTLIRSGNYVEKSRVYRGITVKTFSGTVFGLDLTYTEKSKGKDSLTKDIIVKFSRRESLRVINGVLFSAARLKYDAVLTKLESKGINITSTEDTGNGIINISLSADSLNLKQKKNFTITDNTAGAFSLHINVSEIKSLLSKDYTSVRKEMRQNNKTYNLTKISDAERNPLLFIFEKNNKISGISIISEKFRNKQDIGPGSSAGQVRNTYKNIKIGKLIGGAYILKVKNCNQIFVLDAEKINTENEKEINRTKISTVIIGTNQYLEDYDMSE